MFSGAAAVENCWAWTRWVTGSLGKSCMCGTAECRHLVLRFVMNAVCNVSLLAAGVEVSLETVLLHCEHLMGKGVEQDYFISCLMIYAR